MTLPDHWPNLPRFGERLPGIHYTPRPGSYGVALDEGARRLCVVQLGDRFFLPGGGAEGDETEAETLTREVREECARSVTLVRRLGAAVQYVLPRGEVAYAKVCAFYEVRLGEELATAPEDEHVTLWMPTAQARERLSHESQRWALDLAIDRR
ncbi:MAG: NUDIX domain-containing protein [Planctomycetota bacterium]